MAADDIDARILEILREDGRASFTDIAERLKISDVTVHLRVKKLLERGIIRNFSANLDYAKLGYPVVAFVELKIVPGTIDKVIDLLMSLEGVLEVYELHSHCDLIAKVRSKDLADLRNKVVLDIRSKLKEELISDEVHPSLRMVKEGGETSIPLTNDLSPIRVSQNSGGKKVI